MSLLKIRRNNENVTDFREYIEFQNVHPSENNLHLNVESSSDDLQTEVTPKFDTSSDDKKSDLTSEDIIISEVVDVEDSNLSDAITDKKYEDELIIEKAKKEAVEIKEKAEKELEAIKNDINILKEQVQKEAYEEGFNLGQDEGYRAGLNRGEAEIKSSYKQEYNNFQHAISDQINELEKEKQLFLEKYIEDLKDVSIAVAEKIVLANLKGHEDVISRMILAATEKMKKTSWAKIYIGQDEGTINIQGNRDFLNSIARIADQVKVVMIEDEGACIVETPEGIIDLSVKTQIENIRDILKKENV